MSSLRRTMNHLRKQHPEPGEYAQSDGSTLIVEDVGESDRIWRRRFPNVTGDVTLKSPKDWDCRMNAMSVLLDERGQTAATRADKDAYLSSPPRAHKMNAIPGMPNSVNEDYATGKTFESRQQLEAHYKAQGLVDMTLNDIERGVSQEQDKWKECFDTRKQVVRFGNGPMSALYCPARAAGDPTSVSPETFLKESMNG